MQKIPPKNLKFFGKNLPGQTLILRAKGFILRSFNEEGSFNDSGSRAVF
jgi:hypothetical protein